jgi:hypothetical protein
LKYSLLHMDSVNSRAGNRRNWRCVEIPGKQTRVKLVMKWNNTTWSNITAHCYHQVMTFFAIENAQDIEFIMKIYTLDVTARTFLHVSCSKVGTTSPYDNRQLTGAPSRRFRDSECQSKRVLRHGTKLLETAFCLVFASMHGIHQRLCSILETYGYK